MLMITIQLLAQGDQVVVRCEICLLGTRWRLVPVRVRREDQRVLPESFTHYRLLKNALDCGCQSSTTAAQPISQPTMPNSFVKPVPSAGFASIMSVPIV